MTNQTELFPESDHSEQITVKGSWNCISLLQPWADLVVHGHKEWETRSWPTKYRGRLYIHASKGFPKRARELCKQWHEYIRILELQFGAIIGHVELYDVVSSEQAVNELQNCEIEKGINEYQFGDYSPGRYVWKFRDPQWFLRPIPAKGSLSIWKYDYEKTI